MGCSGSKVDQQQPVALCRGRADLLAAAVHHRFALAHAHAAYSDSLLSVSDALHHLLLLSGDARDDYSSPVLPLPSRRKSSPSPPPPPPPAAHIASSSAADEVARHSSSRSQSGSHIHFQPSDSDDEDSQVSPFHSSCASSRLHHYHHPLEEEEQQLPPRYDFTSIYYARSQPPAASVFVEQRPPSYETVQYGCSFFEPSYPSYGYPYPQSSSYYFDGHYGTMDGFFGPSSSAMPPPAASASVLAGRGSSSSSNRAPPPPPSPPRVSTWDFLNPFQSYENYYSYYTPSRSSKEVREEEGIPDLEEEEHEVMKKAYSDQKFGAYISRGAGPAEDYSSPATTFSSSEAGASSVLEQPRYYHPRSSGAGRNSDYDQQVLVDKNVVSGEVRRRARMEEKNAAPAAPSVSQDVTEVASEIKVQFEMAARSARELSALLEVGKHQYHPKHSLYEGEKS